MADLRIPSLQHLARNLANKPETVSNRLVRLALNPPNFSYDPLFGAVKDLLILGQPYDEVLRGISKIRRQVVRDRLLEILPLIHGHFSGVNPDFYQLVGRRHYPVGRGLMVPFEPPMIYGIGGQLYFPWFIFWRTNPLKITDERLSLFVTLVDEILMQDPDLDTAYFQILDFSSPKPKLPRELEVIDTRDIPRISEKRKIEMLECFAEGFNQALVKLKGMPAPSKEERDTQDKDSKQPGLFD
ncbi:hypothetical protein WJT86_00830 [Microvirga sp. W0021]|uniref:Uncharacterized protein n=1 Tax=Hohaiivirga grylli TaxID=3133970 RepID=A0ABV0BHK4_9HYPH